MRPISCDWRKVCHLNPDVQAKLTRIADASGSNGEILAREAIERFVDYDEWFIREVEKGLAQIERGEVLSHAEVGMRLESC
jgi:predicted transcriptional regulator